MITIISFKDLKSPFKRFIIEEAADNIITSYIIRDIAKLIEDTNCIQNQFKINLFALYSLESLFSASAVINILFLRKNY